MKTRTQAGKPPGPSAASGRRRRGRPRDWLPSSKVSLAVLSVVAVVLAGVAFVNLRPSESAEWPSNVAVIGLDPANRRQPVTFLAVVDPVRQVAVTVPPEAVVEIPGSGFLRAYHAYRLGGIDLTARTLESLLGVEIRWAVAGQGSSLQAIAAQIVEGRVPSGRLDEVVDLVAGAQSWQMIGVGGVPVAGARGTVMEIDRETLQAAAQAVGGSPARSVRGRVGAVQPEAEARPPQLSPADILVDVLNGGRVDMAATRTAAGLREAGFRVARVGDFRPQDRPASIVFYRPDTENKAQEVAAMLGYPAEPLPEGLATSADVVVILGDDARL